MFYIIQNHFIIISDLINDLIFTDLAGQGLYIEET